MFYISTAYYSLKLRNFHSENLLVGLRIAPNAPSFQNVTYTFKYCTSWNLCG